MKVTAEDYYSDKDDNDDVADDDGDDGDGESDYDDDADSLVVESRRGCFENRFMNTFRSLNEQETTQTGKLLLS